MDIFYRLHALVGSIMFWPKNWDLLIFSLLLLQLYYDDKETVAVEKPEDGLVMLELQFLNQQIVIKAGYNEVKLNYADRTIYHKTDPIKIRQIEVKIIF